jgi:hypothetical protein
MFKYSVVLSTLYEVAASNEGRCFCLAFHIMMFTWQQCVTIITAASKTKERCELLHQQALPNTEDSHFHGNFSKSSVPMASSNMEAYGSHQMPFLGLFQ